MIGLYLWVNIRKGYGRGLTFTTRKFPSTSQAAKIISAEHEQDTQNKFKVREMNVHFQPRLEIIFSQPSKPPVAWNKDRFLQNIQNGKHTLVDRIRCVDHEKRCVSVHTSVRGTINGHSEKKGRAQEECLCCRQSPVVGCQCLSGNARACNAERDDLTCQKRQNKTPCPYARETLPRAAAKGADR